MATDNCYIFPSQMCPNNYTQCELNIFDFWSVICFYYESLTNGVANALANFPIMLILFPTLPIIGLLYVLYLISYPFYSFIGYTLPSLVPVLIPVTAFILVGASRIRLIRWFVK